MKPLCLLPLFALVLSGCAETSYYGSQPPPQPTYSQPPGPPPAPPADAQPAGPAPAAQAAYVMSPLDQLCAPIALYPDPIISLILPAATFPDQVQAEASFLQGGGQPQEVDGMNWDSSVRGLGHYPQVAEWMASNPDWTNQLGGAFATEPAAVMDAIQELRRRAQTLGSLANSDNEQVVENDGEIEIEPTGTDEIYVPEYDPSVVFVEQYPGFNYGGCIGWGPAYPAGVWLQFDFDWRSHQVWTGDWYHYHMQNGGWARPVNYANVRANVNVTNITINNNSYHGWTPPPHHPPAPPQLSAHGEAHVSAQTQARFAQPRPMPGAPMPPVRAAHVESIEQSRQHGPQPKPVPAQAAQPHSQPNGQRPEAQPTSEPARAQQGEQAPTQEQQHADPVKAQQANAQKTQQERVQEQQRQAEQAKNGQQAKAEEQAKSDEQARAQQQQRQAEEEKAQTQQKAEQAKTEQQQTEQQRSEPQHAEQARGPEEERQKAEQPARPGEPSKDQPATKTPPKKKPEQKKPEPPPPQPQPQQQ